MTGDGPPSCPSTHQHNTQEALVLFLGMHRHDLGLDFSLFFFFFFSFLPQHCFAVAAVC